MHCLITNTGNRLKNELLDYEFGKQMRCLITKMGNKLKGALPSYEYGKQTGNNQENKVKSDCLGTTLAAGTLLCFLEGYYPRVQLCIYFPTSKRKGMLLYRSHPVDSSYGKSSNQLYHIAILVLWPYW